MDMTPVYTMNMRHMKGGRRYRFGKFFRRKYGFSGYRNSKTGRRIINEKKYFKTGMVNVKCEYFDTIASVTGSPNAIFASNSSPEVDFHLMLTGSLTFQDIGVNYNYYKINGIAVRCAKMFQESQAAVYPNAGIPPLYINFFPTTTGTGYGAAVRTADSVFRVDPYVTGVQSRYISIPKNFTAGTNGSGLGIWNAYGSASTLTGEFDTFCQSSVNAVSTTNLYDIRITIYVSLCNDAL